MANEGQGQLSHSHDPRASSPACRWQGTRSWEMASLPHPPTAQLTSCESAFLHLHPWGQLTCAPAEFRFLKYSCLRYLGVRIKSKDRIHLFHVFPYLLKCIKSAYVVRVQRSEESVLSMWISGIKLRLSDLEASTH